MIGNRWKKLLTILGTILALNFTFFTFASAIDLSMVVNKEDIHPKLSSSLWELEKDYEKRAMAAQAYAQSRTFVKEYPNMITVYLISEPGTIIDETSLQVYGAEIIKSADNVWKARVPVNMLETIADNVKGISFIKLPDRAIPSAIESEGVGLTGASSSYHFAGYTGAGVKIAVIDLGFAELSSAVSDGELPNTVVTIDCTGSSCIPTDFYSETNFHGTAVAEIVYDMAPGAQLYLIKISDTLDLKDTKDYCIANGIEIINFSATFSNTNFYSGECYDDNSVCSANDAYDNGILWVNAMGNYAKKHYGGTFTDANGDNLHDQSIEIEALTGETIDVSLTWDVWPTTDQDYELHLFDSASNLLASSESAQTGTQPPVESLDYLVPATGTYYLHIYNYSTTSNHRLSVFSSNHDIAPAVASSSLSAPADAAKVMAVGAIAYDNWTTGPQEDFSSQGPTYDGRTKPEISGPDAVITHTYGDYFYGTSASSPHVAGAAALILAKNPTYSVQKLWNALISSSVEMSADMGDSGQDNIYGYGRLQLQLSGSSYLYFPHIAAINSWETEVCIINTSSSQALGGNLTAYTNSGQQVASKTISLDANARVEYTVGSDFTDPADIGYMIFESESEDMCGHMKFFIESQYQGAIPATSDVNITDVYIPHIASNANWWTGVSLLNTTDASKTLTIEFSNGTTHAKTISANEHQAFTIRSLFSGVSQPTIESAVIKNAGGIVGLELFGSNADSYDSYLSGVLLKDDYTKELYFPHIASNANWWTGIVAYNPSSNTSTMTITPYMNNGTPLTELTKDLVGGTKYIGTAETLDLPEGTAWFHISATQPLTGFELFGTNDSKQLGGYTSVNISRTNGVFPKIETSGWTGIALVNIENSSAIVTLTAYDDNGGEIDTEILSLSAHEKTVALVENIFSLDISSATYISFSSSNAIVGFQLNGSNDGMMLDALPGM